jgi:hypothetical protein
MMDVEVEIHYFDIFLAWTWSKQKLIEVILKKNKGIIC